MFDQFEYNDKSVVFSNGTSLVRHRWHTREALLIENANHKYQCIQYASSSGFAAQTMREHVFSKTMPKLLPADDQEVFEFAPGAIVEFQDVYVLSAPVNCFDGENSTINTSLSILDCMPADCAFDSLMMSFESCSMNSPTASESSFTSDE